MAVINVVDEKGAKVSEAQIPAALVDVGGHPANVHQVVKTLLAAQRAGTHSTKTRGEVRGGGKKPWRQKGTGRARHGSTRSPIWTGGGVTFGPQPRSYEMKLNKKMRRLALRQVLADRIETDRIVVATGLGVAEGKTKEATAFLSAISEAGKVLLIVPEHTELVIRAFGNLPKVKMIEMNEMNVYDVLWADRLVFVEEAWKGFEEAAS